MSYVGLGARLRTPLRSISIGLIGWLLVCGPGWAQEDGSTGEAPEVAGAAEAGPLQGEAAQPQPSFQPFNRLLPPMTEAPCIEEPPEPLPISACYRCVSIISSGCPPTIRCGEATSNGKKICSITIGNGEIKCETSGGHCTSV